MITMIVSMLVALMFFSGTSLSSLYRLFSHRVKRVGDLADERIEKGMERRREQEARREERRSRREEARTAQAGAEQTNASEATSEGQKTRKTKPFNPDIPIGPEASEPIGSDGRENFLPDFIYSDNDHSQPAGGIHAPVLPPIVPDEQSAPVPPAGTDLPPVTDPKPPRPPRKKKPAPTPDETQPQEPSGFDVPAPDGDPQQTPAYRKPPLTFLREPVINAEYGSSQAEIEHNSALLIKTLESFNVHASITGVFRGPSVTRYELVPAEGVKISKITALADDIALRLAASGVRIEAPIPNKAAIGIEVPNRSKASVTLREIIDTDVYRTGTSKSILNVALGKDIAGKVICADLAKMPHLLIAGTTGSGKSVCVNSMIMSILYNADPNEVKLLMIDPKQVEFTVYSGIPHLLVPVVSDPRKASGALGWAVTEMLGRYKKFSERNVRDISGYNRLADEDPSMERMSRIVIFIDELSDLMMVAQSEVEDAICRLAQMARAAGMHLVIATQRPSVDVITGLIKANIPSRIALSVSSQVDSRTIIDTAGAEKLLGYGDMLFSPVGLSKPLRVQGCFVSENEVEEVVSFIKHQKESRYDESVMDEIERQSVAKKKGAELPPPEEGEEAEDPKLMKAIEIIVEAGMASTTMLQRKLSIGYGRAGRIIDQLESRKIVGPFEGSKPRKVLITRQQWMEMCAASSDLPSAAGDDADAADFTDDDLPFDLDTYDEAGDDFE
ncbi:MAG: DNA translocase FtsK [Clostridia bacterium]|nr:DNA translocase FtsK [Clostridia bacterium]